MRSNSHHMELLRCRHQLHHSIARGARIGTGRRPHAVTRPCGPTDLARKNEFLKDISHAASCSQPVKFERLQRQTTSAGNSTRRDFTESRSMEASSATSPNISSVAESPSTENVRKASVHVPRRRPDMSPHSHGLLATGSGSNVLQPRQHKPLKAMPLRAFPHLDTQVTPSWHAQQMSAMPTVAEQLGEESHARTNGSRDGGITSPSRSELEKGHWPNLSPAAARTEARVRAIVEHHFPNEVPTAQLPVPDSMRDRARPRATDVGVSRRAPTLSSSTSAASSLANSNAQRQRRPLSASVGFEWTEGSILRGSNFSAPHASGATSSASAVHLSDRTDASVNLRHSNPTTKAHGANSQGHAGKQFAWGLPSENTAPSAQGHDLLQQANSRRAAHHGVENVAPARENVAPAPNIETGSTDSAVKTTDHMLANADVADVLTAATVPLLTQTNSLQHESQGQRTDANDTNASIDASNDSNSPVTGPAKGKISTQVQEWEQVMHTLIMQAAQEGADVDIAVDIPTTTQPHHDSTNEQQQSLEVSPVSQSKSKSSASKAEAPVTSTVPSTANNSPPRNRYITPTGSATSSPHANTVTTTGDDVASAASHHRTTRSTPVVAKLPTMTNSLTPLSTSAHGVGGVGELGNSQDSRAPSPSLLSSAVQRPSSPSHRVAASIEASMGHDQRVGELSARIESLQVELAIHRRRSASLAAECQSWKRRCGDQEGMIQNLEVVVAEAKKRASTACNRSDVYLDRLRESRQTIADQQRLLSVHELALASAKAGNTVVVSPRSDVGNR